MRGFAPFEMDEYNANAGRRRESGLQLQLQYSLWQYVRSKKGRVQWPPYPVY